jgi:uncharacterized protein
LTGTIVNVGTILAGTFIGVLLKKGLPENYKDTILQGLNISIIIIGIQMAIKTQNILIIVSSLVLGAITGEFLKIEDKLKWLGQKLESCVGRGEGQFAKAFITSSLVFCVGAMAIVGSIQDGVQNDPSTLYVKSVLDGTASIIFSSTMGIGVAFSAFSVLIYQGTITLLAQYLHSFLTTPIITEMSATGGILIIGIGLRLMELKDIRVGNLLPSIGYAVILTKFMTEIIEFIKSIGNSMGI